MKHLWAPWRAEYIYRRQAPGCFLCRASRARRDAPHLVLYRGEQALALLNRFPYNNGHLMVAPRRHTGDIALLTPGEGQELFALLARVVQVLRQEFKPDGFNIGMNLGRVAGAGLPGHLHIHVVPRWNGDTNFMPVTGRTKVINELLGTTFTRLRARF